MRLMRLTAALLALGAAACSTPNQPLWMAQSPLIDEPEGYPYNSRFCP